MDQKCTLTQKDMFDYGYLWPGMTPLTRDEALSRYDNGLCVYRLNDDDSEGEVAERCEIERHEGMFGYETPDYSADEI